MCEKKEEVMPGFNEWLLKQNLPEPEPGTSAFEITEWAKVNLDTQEKAVAFFMLAGFIPKDEQWLHENEAALESVKQGLDDSVNRKVVDRTF